MLIILAKKQINFPLNSKKGYTTVLRKRFDSKDRMYKNFDIENLQENGIKDEFLPYHEHVKTIVAIQSNNDADNIEKILARTESIYDVRFLQEKCQVCPELARTPNLLSSDSCPFQK